MTSFQQYDPEGECPQLGRAMPLSVPIKAPQGTWPLLITEHRGKDGRIFLSTDAGKGS